MPKKNPDQRNFNFFIQTEPSIFWDENGKKRRIRNKHPVSSKVRRENSRATPKRRIGPSRIWSNDT